MSLNSISRSIVGNTYLSSSLQSAATITLHEYHHVTLCFVQEAKNVWKSSISLTNDKWASIWTLNFNYMKLKLPMHKNSNKTVCISWCQYNTYLARQQSFVYTLTTILTEVAKPRHVHALCISNHFHINYILLYIFYKFHSNMAISSCWCNFHRHECI